MAVTITAAEVKAIQATNLPDSVIDDIIAFMDTADACLDAHGLPDAIQRLLKLYGAAHMLYESTSGHVQSERSPTGAARTYKDSGDGAGGSPWGIQLKQMDQFGCITGLLMNDATVYVGSVGPGGRRQNIYPKSGK